MNMKKPDSKPDIHSYFDFRKFLSDYLTYLRNKNANFSFQKLVDDYGLNSRSHYIDIINGRVLTRRFVPIYEKICDFNDKEAQYFRTLVAFNQSKSIDGKKELFEQINKLAPNLETLQLEHEVYDYFKHWYIPAMISMLDISKNENDHRILAKQFNPPISAVEARKALNTLIKIGFISWDSNKSEWIFHKKFFKCSSESKAVALREFHLQMHSLGNNAYTNQFNDQTFSTLTVSVSEKTRKEIDIMIAQLKDRVMEKAKEDCQPQVVVQVNFQSFLLSQTKRKIQKEGK